jgi:hypothetical protein
MNPRNQPNDSTSYRHEYKTHDGRMDFYISGPVFIIVWSGAGYKLLYGWYKSWIAMVESEEDLPYRTKASA